MAPCTSVRLPGWRSFQCGAGIQGGEGAIGGDGRGQEGGEGEDGRADQLHEL